MSKYAEYKRGQIYLANLPEIGRSVQYGMRPVIICSNDKNNNHSPCITVIPLTTSRIKKDLPTHIKVLGGGFVKESIALGESITTIFKDLLIEYMGELDNEEMKEVDSIIALQLGLSLK